MSDNTASRGAVGRAVQVDDHLDHRHGLRATSCDDF